MAIATSTAILLAAATTTAVSVSQGKKAQKASEKAQQIDTKRQNFQMAREKRKQIRQAWAAQAQVQATSFAQGTAATSRTAAITGNISSERAQNLSFLDSSQGFTSAIGKQNIIASRARTAQATTQSLGKLAQAGIGAADSAGLFDNPE